MKHPFAPQPSQIAKHLGAVLRDDRPTSPQLNTIIATPQGLTALETHGVSALVYHKLRPQLPEGLEASEAWMRLKQQVRLQAAVSLMRERAVRQMLDDLAAHGIRSLLLKGVPLGYTHYPAPETRPCCDTDLLVHPHDRPQVDRVLRDQGYQTQYDMPSSQFVTYQVTYTKTGLAGVDHAVDVHWRINNRQVFANRLSFEELATEAHPVPQLGKHAFTLAPVYALLHACLHRMAHQDHRDRLIWLYDIHLLVGRMTPEEIGQFADLAANKELRAVCWSGLNRAQYYFATPLPGTLVAALQPSKAEATPEASAYFLTPKQRLWQVLCSDLCALPGWLNRLYLIKEHLFPPATYMVARYAAVHRTCLPVLYVYRLLRGLIRFWQTVDY